MFDRALLFASGQVVSSTHALDALVYYGAQVVVQPDPAPTHKSPIDRCRCCGRKQPAEAITCAGCGAVQ